MAEHDNERDDLIDLIDDQADPRAALTKRWKIAVIDDDQAVHEGTRYALADYQLNGYGLELLYAHSAEDGKALLLAEPDIAVILLDVVMERETAGLELVEFIRKDLGNDIVRIVLRTGQPGQAPERRVIVDYDINDYKAKTDLTADRLFTTVTAALRSYQQLARMSETRRGLEIILEAASSLFDFQSMQKLGEGVLTQLASLLDADCEGMLIVRERDDQDFSILACSGCYRALTGLEGRSDLAPDILQRIRRAFVQRQTQFETDQSTLYFRTVSGTEIVVLLEAGRLLSDTDRALVEIFCSRLAVAFDNVILYEQLHRSNVELDRRVTERTRELKVANARLRTQWLQARRTNAFQREVIGTVAHDIRNPLSVVLGRTEMMKEMIAAAEFRPDVLQTQVDYVRAAASRLSDMVSELLNQALTDAMDITLRRDRIDVAALTRDVIEANQVLAQRKGQQIRLSLPGEPVCIQADPDRLREAVDNLVSNAVKYSPLDSAIDVSLTSDDDAVTLRIRDSGPGLSADDMRRLFGRFQRLSAKPTGGEPSTGLGLSIAKKIATLHGGDLTAESPGAGLGSTFILRLTHDGEVAA